MSDTTQVILQFLSSIDIFLLIMVRILGFVIIMPVLAGGSIPNVVKAGLSAAIAYVIFSSSKVVDVQYIDTVFGYGILIVEEFAVGFLIAFVVYMFFSIMYFVGQLIDMQIGFSMVSVLDPFTQIQAPVAGNMLFMVMAALLVQSGGLNAFIQAIYYSYDVLPIGYANFLGNGNIYAELSKIISLYLALGLQISLPIVGSMLVVDVALGILVKAVPQMNVFVVGMPLKVLLGLSIFYFVTPVFYDIYDLIFSHSMRAVIAIIKGMT